MLLEGEALVVWVCANRRAAKTLRHSQDQKRDFCCVITPMEFVSLDDFHRCKLQPGEVLSVFVHDLKKLLEQAVLGLEEKARN